MPSTQRGVFSYMGEMPIPAETFFHDFSSDVLDYNVLNDTAIVGTYRGLSNSDENGNYIGFLMSEQPHISAGNILCTIDGLERFTVRRISYDRYNGKAELFKAYY